MNTRGPNDRDIKRSCRRGVIYLARDKKSDDVTYFTSTLRDLNVIVDSRDVAHW